MNISNNNWGNWSSITVSSSSSIPYSGSSWTSVEAVDPAWSVTGWTTAVIGPSGPIGATGFPGAIGPTGVTGFDVIEPIAREQWAPNYVPEDIRFPRYERKKKHNHPLTNVFV